MAAAQINSEEDYFGDDDMNDDILSAMKHEYYRRLPRRYSSEYYEGSKVFMCNLASQDFVDITKQRIKRMGAEYATHKTDKMALNIDPDEYKLAIIDGKEQLLKTICGKDKIIVPWEDSFELVWQYHKENCHPDAPELMEIMQKEYLVNRNTIECLSELCPVCKGENQPNVKFNLEYFAMSLDPNNTFSNILVYEDVHTKLFRLKPINKNRSSPQGLAKELIKVFMDFGPPRKLLMSHPTLLKVFNDFPEFRRVFDFDCVVKKVKANYGKINCLRTEITKWMKENNGVDWGDNIQNIERDMNEKVCGKKTKPLNVFIPKKTATATLKHENNDIENIPLPNLCSSNDPILPIDFTDDPDDNILGNLLDEDMIGVDAMLDDKDPPLFDENLFDYILENTDSIGNELEEKNEEVQVPVQTLETQSLPSQDSEEMDTEDSPPVANIAPRTLHLLAYTINAPIELEVPAILLICEAPLVQIFPEGFEYF